MELLKKYLTEENIHKFLSVILLLIIMYLLKPFKNMLLLTFILSFLFNELIKYIYNKLNPQIKISKKVITVTVFVLFIILIIGVSIVYIPKLTTELLNLKNDLLSVINESSFYQFNDYLTQFTNINYYINYLKENSGLAIKTISEVKDGTITVLSSVILSFLLLLGQDSLYDFSKKIEKSKVKYLYGFYKKLAIIFLNSFGKIIQVQLVIAVINSLLSIIGLLILGFPNIIAIGFMILVLSLIPVFGVVVSLVPLSLIALKIGGIQKVIEVIILIILLHALETYFIHPRLMSEKSHLPIFITFLILILSEHMLGVWGLLIGVPSFMFFMELLDIK